MTVNVTYRDFMHNFSNGGQYMERTTSYSDVREHGFYEGFLYIEQKGQTTYIKQASIERIEVTI